MSRCAVIRPAARRISPSLNLSRTSAMEPEASKLAPNGSILLARSACSFARRWAISSFSSSIFSPSSLNGIHGLNRWKLSRTILYHWAYSFTCSCTVFDTKAVQGSEIRMCRCDGAAREAAEPLYRPKTHAIERRRSSVRQYSFAKKKPVVRLFVPLSAPGVRARPQLKMGVDLLETTSKLGGPLVKQFYVFLST